MKTLKKWLVVVQVAMPLLFFSATSLKAADAYYYEIKVYHFKTDTQEKRLNAFFKDALVPSLHDAGIKNVGVFRPIKQDTDKRFYVFIPCKNWEQLEGLDQKLSKDKSYNKDGKDYVDASFNSYPYTRIETIILRAFEDMEEPAKPKLKADKAARVYELRSYESASEKAGASKIKMMNDGGEMKLFKKLDFNAVFYGKVIAGSRMPNMMYMTTFNSKEERDARWKEFGESSDWKKLVAKEEYQHNMNKSDIWLLHPMDYSDF
ncbi:MAG TPA: NIPSNAP family protein [Mucilaginibacter sp.]|jgi:hypothetical protein